MKKYLFYFILILSFKAYANEQKSKVVAVGLSIIFPGVGEYYLDNEINWKTPFLAESGIVGGYFGLQNYGNNIKNDAHNFALINSDARTNMNDLYYARIGSYSSVYEYNEIMLQQRSLDDLYLPIENYYWNWNTQENRKKYHSQRVKADNIIENSTFLFAAMILNRAISVIRIINHNSNSFKSEKWNIYFKNTDLKNISFVLQKSF